MKVFVPNQVIVRDDMDFPEGALVVDGYGEDGCLLAHSKGGGVQFRVPSGEVSRFSVVSEDEQVQIFRKTQFFLEGVSEKTFEGFTDGSHWNGWEMPYFELKSAQSVLDALGAWTLEENKNVLRAHLDLGNGMEEVEWQPECLPLPDGGSVEGYPIGTGCLVWERV